GRAQAAPAGSPLRAKNTHCAPRTAALLPGEGLLTVPRLWAVAHQATAMKSTRQPALPASRAFGGHLPADAQGGKENAASGWNSWCRGRHTFSSPGGAGAVHGAEGAPSSGGRPRDLTDPRRGHQAASYSVNHAGDRKENDYDDS